MSARATLACGPLPWSAMMETDRIEVELRLSVFVLRQLICFACQLPQLVGRFVGPFLGHQAPQEYTRPCVVALVCILPGWRCSSRAPAEPPTNPVRPSPRSLSSACRSD
jgi:hypothetical protein